MTEQAAAAAQGRKLIATKVLHTVVWVVQGGGILSLPFLAWRGAFGWAAMITVFLLSHAAVLRLNERRCPLTDVAARYTTDRSPNFDAYVPIWLARHNLAIFAPLFVVNELIVLVFWLARPVICAR
ncbi:MAG: hypothetical protein WB341_08620 [Terracidiphilus sp.]